MKGKKTMLVQSKEVLQKARSLAKQNKYNAAKNLLNKYTYLCDIDSEFWTVWQGLHMVYQENKSNTDES